MKRWMLLVVLILSGGTVQAAQENKAPYLYYYSSALNAIVVERADGTDSRTLGEGLTPTEANSNGGPGWSPDGQWFAWFATRLTDGGPDDVGRARAVRLDNQARLKTLEAFVGAVKMLWSPDSHYLFAAGRTAFGGSFRPVSFWVIDVDADQVIAGTNLFGYSLTPAEWKLDEGKVVFYSGEEYPVAASSSTFRVTLFLDGRVLQEPISNDDYTAAAKRLMPEYYDTSLPSYSNPLGSPSGHYVNDKLGVLTNAVTKLSFVLPPHSDAVAPNPMDVRWHPAEVWALFGYQRCFADCSMVGGVNAVNVVTGEHREISQCGFATACVDWLPDNVDINRLPKGQAKSVLPAPLSYNYNVDYATGVELSKDNPFITCDPAATDKRLHILNPKTQETIFILRAKGDCTGTEKMPPTPFAFALSPNGKWYALTDGIYDAHSDELLARFNTYGWDLAFSADSSQLSMRSVNARMVWDVQGLLDADKRVRLLARYFER